MGARPSSAPEQLDAAQPPVSLLVSGSMAHVRGYTNANTGVAVLDCPFEDAFRRRHWIEGYYAACVSCFQQEIRISGMFDVKHRGDDLWRPEEMVFLDHGWPDGMLPLRLMAAVLGRSGNAIKIKAHRRHLNEPGRRRAR